MAARRAVLGAAERVVGAPVRDVVLLVQRRTWAWGAFAVGGVAGLVFTHVAGVTEPFDFAIAGGLAGLGLWAGMTYRFLVRTEQQLLVTTSKRWIGRPTKLIGAVDLRMIVIENGAINRMVTIGADSYQMSRLYEGRMRAMLADLKPPDVPPGYVAYNP